MTCADKARLMTFGVLMALLLSLVSVPAAAQGPEIELNSKAGVLIDAQSGRVLYEHNAHEPLPPASVTKIMTLVLALEAVRDGRVSLDDLVTTSEYAADMGGTQIWLEPGEQMPLRDLLYAVAVGSANDAAVAIAEHLAGSVPAFAELMNAKARELGMKNTQFVNPSGLPPASLGQEGPHVASAYDLAVLSRYALKLPMFLELVSTWGPVVMRPETLEKPVLWTYNKMMRSYPGMDGIKTGMTSEAGYCLSATAKRNGLRLIAVTLGASTRKERDADIRRLLDYGFSRLKAVPVAEKGETIVEAEVSKGETMTVPLLAGDSLSVSMPKESDQTPETEIRYVKRLVAPIAEGETVAHLIARLDGEEVGRVPLVASKPVERASVVRLIGRFFLRLVAIEHS